jgi:hypothetical protein
VSVIGASASNCAEHAVPQLMPVGLDVTVPVPEPAFTTVTAGRALRTEKASCGATPSRSTVSAPTSSVKNTDAPLTTLALLAALSVTVLDPVPVNVVGLKLALSPEGMGPAASVIVPGDLPLSVNVRVAVALCP